MPTLVANQYKRWVFTLNNYTNDDISHIDQFFSNTLPPVAGRDNPIVEYACYGYEVGASGTPHLQGFIKFRGNVRFNRLVQLLPRAHVEGARGTSQQCRSYCLKDGHPNNKEFGTFPGNSGQRNDLLAVREWGVDFIREHGRAPTKRECYREQWTATHRYPNLVEGFEALAPAPVIQDGELRDWQSDLESELLADADDRSVVFYVDKEGNKGKSWFCRYMISKYPEQVQLMSPGKVVDMAYVVDIDTRIFLINVARGQMEYFQYSILENIKDRLVMSTKYRPTTKLLRNKTHVVVMCNEDPDFTKMSQDRYIIREI